MNLIMGVSVAHCWCEEEWGVEYVLENASQIHLHRQWMVEDREKTLPTDTPIFKSTEEGTR